MEWMMVSVNKMDHFSDFLLAVFLMCLCFLAKREGMPGSLLLELSSEESSEEEQELSFCFLYFFLNFSGMTFSFLMELLQASFHHSSFQSVVPPPRVFFPRPRLSSRRLTCTQSVEPCQFLPRPLPSFQPICVISFLAYSLSKRMLETPELCSSRSRYFDDINNLLLLWSLRGRINRGGLMEVDGIMLGCPAAKGRSLWGILLDGESKTLSILLHSN